MSVNPMAISVKALLTCLDIEELQDNRLTFHEVFNEIEISNSAENLDNFFIVVMAQLHEPNKYNCELILLDPDDDLIGNPYGMIVEGEKGITSVNYVVELQSMPISRPGIYKICIRYNEEIIARHDFFVKVKEDEG